MIQSYKLWHEEVGSKENPKAISSEKTVGKINDQVRLSKIQKEKLKTKKLIFLKQAGQVMVPTVKDHDQKKERKYEEEWNYSSTLRPRVPLRTKNNDEHSHWKKKGATTESHIKIRFKKLADGELKTAVKFGSKIEEKNNSENWLMFI